ncbi:Alpha/Beta hydrolase protein [Pseudoneurospora amorphoporcata]|uniref:Alpha/Beta hydrolase protein n=1 Tax=Pseudoneurospora amorphoporcata TaxID=241081 RepID=A0AAN6SDI1_9PEZI|nr:Alpha/Beta hydrolase protein [Pseudoneurospora amorphoporcata]
MTDADDQPSRLARSLLPDPTLSFTLPSLHDGIAIDCRVYHPQSLDPSPSSPPWRKHAAVFAHPYAPLGGCYDDPVVDIAAGTLLKLGFLVGTFNFRGAQGSAGRTSWKAKAEMVDYTSFVGFLSYYVHYLDPFRQHSVPTTSPISEAPDYMGPHGGSRPVTPSASHEINKSPLFLMGGYSYGSMITMQLPSLENMLHQFDTPACSSHAAEIRLRAQHLAEVQNTTLGSARAAALEHQANMLSHSPTGMRFGGEESSRKHHHSRLSFSHDTEERIHKGVVELMAKAKSHKRRLSGKDHSFASGDAAQDTRETKHQPAKDYLPSVPDRAVARPAYLLVSPLQGLINNLASFNLLPRRPSWKGLTRSMSSPAATASPTGELGPGSDTALSLEEAEAKLVRNSTLAIYGDNDGFVPVRKLRLWAARLEGIPNSSFRAHEVSGASHFWAQGRAAYTLKDAIKTFAESLLAKDGS